MDRRGFGRSPDGKVDFEVDAQDIIEIIEDECCPAHLVGHSYGAVPCLLAAQERPELIMSIVLIEPSAFSLVHGNAAVEEFIGRMVAGILRDVNSPPKEFLEGFVSCMGYDRPNLPEPDEIMARSIRASATERRPWMADIDLAALKRAAIPTLIVSGGWDNAPAEAQRIGGNAFHAVAEVLERELPKARRIVVKGASHNPHMAAVFNREVQRFWHEMEIHDNGGQTDTVLTNAESA